MCSSQRRAGLLSLFVPEARVSRIDRSDIGAIDFGVVGPTQVELRARCNRPRNAEHAESNMDDSEAGFAVSHMSHLRSFCKLIETCLAKTAQLLRKNGIPCCAEFWQLSLDGLKLFVPGLPK